MVKKVDFSGDIVEVQDIWDKLHTTRYNVALVLGFSLLVLPVDFTAYFHPVLTTGDLEWVCLSGTECQKLQEQADPGVDVRCQLTNTTSQWVYTSPQWTVVEEFNLICDRAWYYALYNSFYQTGFLIGLPVFGTLTDWKGKYLSHGISWTILLTAFALLSAAPDLTSLLVFQILLGIGGGAAYSINYARRMEFVPSQYRNKASCAFSLSETGSIIIGLPLCLWMGNWRHSLALSSLLCLPGYVFLSLPDSPQSLISRNKVHKAKSLIDYIASCNDTEVAGYNLKPVNETKLGYKDLLFRNKTVTRYSLAMMMVWFTASVISYGMAYITLNLPGSHILNFALMCTIPACLEIPVRLLLVDKIGRKTSLMLSLVLNGICLIIILALHYAKFSSLYVTLPLFLLVKCSSGVTFSMAYLITLELFPSVLRQQALHGCSVMARVASMSGPLLALIDKLHPGLSLMVILGVNITCFFTSFIIPETKGKPLKDSYEDLIRYQVAYQANSHAVEVKNLLDHADDSDEFLEHGAA